MVLKTLLVTFPNVLLRSGEIGRFRSFLNQQIGWQDDLFHNHTEKPNGVIYRYPRIQYRVNRGKATLFGIQEGFDALNTFLTEQLDNLPEAFWQVERKEQRTRLELTPTSQTYILHNWLGLNTILNRDGSVLDLEKLYNELTGPDERRAMLERILTAQLLKFCSEMGCRLPTGQLQVTVNDIEETGLRRLRSQTGQMQLRSFRVMYTSNLYLPDYISFGKGVSKGYGWQIQDKPS
ncbi:CRISPR-associated endonuclease Cas6 [Spirosoma litoris]